MIIFDNRTLCPEKSNEIFHSKDRFHRTGFYHLRVDNALITLYKTETKQKLMACVIYYRVICYFVRFVNSRHIKFLFTLYWWMIIQINELITWRDRKKCTLWSEFILITFRCYFYWKTLQTNFAIQTKCTISYLLRTTKENPSFPLQAKPRSIATKITAIYQFSPHFFTYFFTTH